jgi:hypothetical protein
LLAFFVVFYHFPSEHTKERFFKSSTPATPSTTLSPFLSSLQTLIHLNLITQEITESAENKVEKRKHREQSAFKTQPLAVLSLSSWSHLSFAVGIALKSGSSVLLSHLMWS